MILQFVGFFTLIVGGGWLFWWAGTELFNFFRYQVSIPLDFDEVFGMVILLVLICVGGVMVYYAFAAAPFTFALDFNLEV